MVTLAVTAHNAGQLVLGGRRSVRIAADGDRRRAEDSSRLEQLRCWARTCLARFARSLISFRAGCCRSWMRLVIIIGFLLILVGAPPMILLAW